MWDMRKTPTLYLRDMENRGKLTRTPNPACQWVFDGEGVATRKYDGACFMLDDDRYWWARREVKPDRAAPIGYQLLGIDPNTHKQIGWEPANNSSFRWALDSAIYHDRIKVPGTYELCGPKINRNPEGFPRHRLIRHADAEIIDNVPTDFDALNGFLYTFPNEGIVWHHEDGRMAKIKRRDFGYRGM